MKKLLSILSATALLLPALAFPLAFPAKGADVITAAFSAVAPQASVSLFAGSGATASVKLSAEDTVAAQFVTTAPAGTLALEVSGNGTVSVSLFRFRNDADISQLQEPLAEVSVTVKAKGWVVISFPDKEPLPAGEYVLAVHDAGNLSLPASGAHESQFVYRNGRLDKSCALRLTAEYASTPAAGLYGKPTAPAVEDINEYAPHMASALRFDTDKGIANIGGCNALTTAFMEEDCVAFTRFKPDTDAGDPYAFIDLPSSTVKTDEYKYLLIKVRLDADAPLKGQLYFITDETSIAEPASVHFTYQSTTDWQYVLINLGGNSLYKGLLKTVRYDVFESVKGTHYADVAYMALFRTKEAAAAFRDNFADYEVEEPEKPTEPTPDYSTYQRADAAAQPADGKLTANGKLNYLYRQYDYVMDFTGSPEEYHSGLDFGFTGLSDALVVDGQLRCRAFRDCSFFTRRILGDNYGLRGGELAFDLSLTAGSLSVTLRQMLENDAPTYSGVVFTLTPDGHMTVRERDGFAVDIDTGIVFADGSAHRMVFRDAVTALEVLCDGKIVASIGYDSYAQTLTCGDVTAKAPHTPGAGYATVNLHSTRGYVDNVTYSHVDVVPAETKATLPVDYSTWVAVDDLGRVTPTDEAGQGEDRLVGMFYFMFHSHFSGRHTNDVTATYLEKGFDFLTGMLSSFAGRDGAYWAEPYFGYYSSNDTWVYRKHAYMLDAAGVDFVFLDLSNDVFYEDQLKILFDTWLDIRRAGGSTPQICFMFGDMPFTFVDGVYRLRSFLENPDYQELLFRWEGKPLILGNNDGLQYRTGVYRVWTVSDSTPQTQEQYNALVEKNPEIKNAIKSGEMEEFLKTCTVRKSWAWQNSDRRKGLGYWDWLQDYPQKPGRDFEGNIEQMAVLLGTHAHSGRGRSLTNGDTSYNTIGQFGFGLESTKYGLQLAESFEYALKQNVRVIMITGWNEWYAGVQKTGNQEQTCGGTLTPGYYMVDQMSPEYSRDGEPMRLRDGVGFGDNYYYQMVSYIRKFKGIHAPATVNGGAMDIHAADIAAQWKNVTPLFTDTVGDANLRSELSWASEFRYTNASARNDIACAQVSQDADKVYFFVTTANALITADDETWMNLYLNTDGDSKTGWEGYDFILNRSRTDKTVSIERFVDGKWQFEKVGEAEYALCENGLMLAVSKTLIGGESGKALSLTFKWADHADIRGDIMRFMELGDTAPNDRFAFAYNASGLTDERTAEPGTETGTGAETDTATEPSTTEAPAETTGAETEAGKTGCSSAISAVVPVMLASAGAALAVRGSAQRRRKRRME